ncbi:MAG: hypothetical protein ACYC4L_04710 [Chloroflexota bacterium]
MLNLTMRAEVVVMVKRKQRDQQGKLIRCASCDHVLGMYCADGVAIVHRGREILAEKVIAIRCECGVVWKPEPESPKPASSAN